MYSSLLSIMKICTKTLENLEALRLFLEMSDEDYNFLTKRKEDSIVNEELKSFLVINSYSLSDLVHNTNKNIEIIITSIPENVEKTEINLLKYDDLWKEYLVNKTAKDVTEFKKDVLDVLFVCKKWLKYFEEEEDCGTESSYSDYSGDDTDTSDDEDSDDKTEESS